jgi:hypothetical protein
MIPIEPRLTYPAAERLTFARHQPSYLALPALVKPDGTVITEWQLTEEELLMLLEGGTIQLTLLYTGVTASPPQPLTPIKLDVLEKPR